MSDQTKLIFSSKPAWYNFWHIYSVYADRIELPHWFGKVVVPLEDIESVEVRPPLVIGDLFRGKGLAYALSIKLDYADMVRHVAVIRKHRKIKGLRFSPDDPAAFVKACQTALEQTR